MPDTMLMSPPPGPLNPTQYIAAVIAAAGPSLDAKGDTDALTPLARAMVPLFGEFTVSDGVAMIATLRTGAAATPETDARGEGDYNANALFAVTSLLEDFCCHARGKTPADHAARAWLMMRHATEGGEWDLGPNNLEAASKNLHQEAFHRFVAAETFASGTADCLGWLDRAATAAGEDREDDDA